MKQEQHALKRNVQRIETKQLLETKQITDRDVSGN